MALAHRPLARVLLVDGMVALIVVGFTVVGTTRAAEDQVPPASALDPLAYGLLVVAAASVAAYRARPLAGLALAGGATVAYIALSYPYGPIFFTVLICMYGVAKGHPARRSAVAGALAALGLLAGHLIGGHIAVLPQVGLWLAASSVLLGVPWAGGTLVRVRAEADRRSREEQARRYADEERLRVAREVHDVVGHGLAAINMQAGVALHVLERRPEQARPALEAIKRTSKDALDELRGTLAVFRQPDDPESSAAPTRPPPGLQQLNTLIRSMNDAGLPVDLADASQLTSEDTSKPAVPAAVDVAAYRIVQQSLTNTLRHAGPATATVRVSREAGDVTIDVVDNGRVATDPGRVGLPDRPGGGHGIAGMRERATGVGGTLEAGPRPEGGFHVHARLPATEEGSTRE